MAAEPAAPASARRSTRLATGVLLSLACLALAYGVVSETVSATLRTRDPDVALAWMPSNGATLETIAQARTAEAVTESDIGEAANLAARSVRAQPIATIPLRILAEAQLLRGDNERARTLMGLAGRRNFRDTRVQLWLFEEGLAQKRYAEAMMRADLLLTRRYELGANLYPRIAAVMDQPAARTALLARLGAAPSWRSEFLHVQAEKGDPGGLAVWLMQNLRSSPHPTTQKELGYVAGAFASQGRWRDVRNLWTQFGGPLLLDGGFQLGSSEPPFGWKLENRDGAVGSIERADGPNRSLYAEFPSGRKSILAEQLLVLPPGRYRLSGRSKVERTPSDSYFNVTVGCAQSEGPPIGVVPAGPPGGWRAWALNFDVADGCDAQRLQVMGSGGEGYQAASAWFDDFKLERLP